MAPGFNGSMNKLKEIYNLYVHRKMLTMVAFGFASGFPYLLVFSTLSLWLKEEGWTYAAIGAFSLVKLPYGLKWIWSPLIDKIRLPWLWKMGRRRSWALLMQLFLFVFVSALSLSDPAENATYIWIVAFVVSFISASLDIVLDAYRVETFQTCPEEQASGAAVYLLGYRLGLIFSGAGALWLADDMSWNAVYLLMALGSLVGLVTVLVVKEPLTEFKYTVQDHSPLPVLQQLKIFYQMSIKAPFKDFIRYRRWPLILFLIFFYRMSDAYVAPMFFPFYVDMGFSKIEIAAITKVYGMAATIAGVLFCGVLIKQRGLYRAMYYCGLAQGLTTLLFSFQALTGHNVVLLILTISLENFFSGMANTILVAYISSLCNVLYTATQYALLSSISTLPRDLLAASSGILAELTGWPMFFAIAALFCLPGLWALRKIAGPKLFNCDCNLPENKV